MSSLFFRGEIGHLPVLIFDMLAPFVLGGCHAEAFFAVDHLPRAFHGVRAQLMKSITTKAGTPEDNAIEEISNTTDPAQKLALIDKFNADFGKGDLAISG